MKKVILGGAITLVSGLLASFFGGMAVDALWFVSNEFVPECENVPNGWHDACIKENQSYYVGKPIVVLALFLSPTVTYLVAIFRSD